MTIYGMFCGCSFGIFKSYPGVEDAPCEHCGETVNTYAYEFNSVEVPIPFEDAMLLAGWNGPRD